MKVKVDYFPNIDTFRIVSDHSPEDVPAFMKRFGLAAHEGRIATRDPYFVINLKLNASEFIACESTKATIEKIESLYRKSFAIEPAPGFAYQSLNEIDLFPFQIVGVRFLTAKRRGILADDQGLGKTIQIVAALNNVDFKHALIVCPAHLTGVWLNALSKFMTKRGVKFSVSSYEMFVKNAHLYTDTDVAVFDEFHYVKNPKSQRGRAFQQLASNKNRRIWLASGTPMTTRAMDLFAPVNALAPRVFKGFTKTRFAEHFCAGYWENSGFGKRLVAKGTSNHYELNYRLRCSGVMLRRSKPLLLTSRQLTLPEAAAPEYLFFDPDKKTAEILDSIKEDQITAILSGDEKRVMGATATALSQIGEFKIDHCVDYLTAFLDENPHEKIVVFAWHKSVTRALADALSEFGVVVVTGDTKKADKLTAEVRFNEDPNNRVFVGNIKAAGTGLTLTAARFCFFCEISWTPGDLAQAQDRINRISQERKPEFYYLLWQHPLERRVLDSVLKKKSDIEKVFEMKGGEK